MSTQHNGDKIGTLATPTHQEVQMVSLRFAERQREGQKWKFQRYLLQLWKVRSFGQVLLCKRWKSKRERRETAKVGMIVKVGQSEREGQKVKVGTRQVKVGSNKGQQE